MKEMTEQSRFSDFRVYFANGRTMTVLAQSANEAKNAAEALHMPSLHALPAKKAVRLGAKA